MCKHSPQLVFHNMTVSSSDPRAIWVESGDIPELVCACLCDASNGRWVMVMNSTDNPDVFFPPWWTTQAGSPGVEQAAEPLRDFLPQLPNGAILFTSRVHDVACELTGDDGSIVKVGPMGKESTR
jgi:hypothetical protein